MGDGIAHFGRDPNHLLYFEAGSPGGLDLKWSGKLAPGEGGEEV